MEASKGYRAVGDVAGFFGRDCTVEVQLGNEQDQSSSNVGCGTESLGKKRSESHDSNRHR